MSRRTVKAVALVIVGCCVCGFAAAEGVSERIERGAGSAREITETFRPVGLVTISTTSGDCAVRIGGDSEIRVDVTHSYPAGTFEAEMEMRINELVLKERFRAPARRGNSSWTITVPEQARIRFSTASGDFEAAGLVASFEADTASGGIRLERCEGDVDINTASGDIRLDRMSGALRANSASAAARGSDLSGKFDIRTASGDIDLDGVRGTVMLRSASGDVEVTGLRVDAESGFSSASGDVNVRLAESPVHDLTLSSASGRATLDYAGNRVEGRVEFTALVNRGRINSPFDFDREETFSRSGQLYARKSFTRGRSTPQITVGTASGTAELKR